MGAILALARSLDIRRRRPVGSRRRGKRGRDRLLPEARRDLGREQVLEAQGRDRGALVQLRRDAQRQRRLGRRRRRGQGADERLLLHRADDQGVAPALPELRTGQAHQAGDPDRSQGRRVAAGVADHQDERRARLLVRARRQRGGRGGRPAGCLLAQLRQALVRLQAAEGGRLARCARPRRLGPVEERKDLKPPPLPPAAETATRLREELASAGYSGAGIARRLHTTGEPIFTHADVEVYRRRPAAVPDRLSTLISLLLLGDPVPPDELGALVVATDVNARALAFARLNLGLNAVENVELREGSLLEPVDGETFGCIACNPPYVVSPDADYTFRDSGLPGDRVSELLARGLPDLLEPGGFATLMASWAQAGDDPAVRPREWLEGSGCDAWILHTTTDDPLSNAAAWTRDAADGPDEFGAALDRWTAYYQESGIEALAYGGLVLRRRNGVSWSRGASLPARPLEPASSHLLRMFAGVDIAMAGADALLDRRLAVAPAARFEQVVSPSEGWTVVSAALSLEEGLGFRADVDEPTLRLLRALDGTRTARDAVVSSLGEEGLPRAAELLRGMLETGFLTNDGRGGGSRRIAPVK